MAETKEQSLHHFRLNNDVTMPSVGLGTYLMDSPDETQRIVEKALEAGYRHIDTAAVYRNEEAVGLGIQHSGLHRDEIFVTTKLWNTDIRSGEALEAIDQSLEKLGLDYVDLYLVHWPVDECYATVWQKMEQLYAAKKARAIGVSNYQQHHLEALLKNAHVVPAINQIECHPYLSQKPLIDYCFKQGILVEAWGPLGMSKPDLLLDETIRSIANELDKTAAQVLLRWNLQRHIVVLPKTVREQRLIENLALFDFELSAQQMDIINALNKNQRMGPDPDNFDF